MIALWCGLALGAESWEGQRYYLGDLHSHTGASGDGGSMDIGACAPGTCGRLDEIGDYARAQGLDFLAVVDHTNGVTAASAEDHARVLETVLAAARPEEGFLTVPGAELWVTLEGGEKLGHKTLLFFGRDAELSAMSIEDTRFNGTFSVVSDCAELWTWMDATTAALGPALLIAHHPAAEKPMPTDWACADEAYAPVVEVYSEHGNSMGSTGYDPVWSGVVEEGSVTTALGLGHRLGFVGGSDNHDTLPGTACRTDSLLTDQPYGPGFTIAVLPEEEDWDRESLGAAITARSAYASTGPFLLARPRYSSGDLVLGMGESGEVSAELVAELQVHPDHALAVTSVRFVGPSGDWLATDLGDGLYTATIGVEELPDWIYPEVVVDGGLWWGEDCPDGGDATERLWLSPTWLVASGGEEGGGEGGGDSGLDGGGDGAADGAADGADGAADGADGAADGADGAEGGGVEGGGGDGRPDSAAETEDPKAEELHLRCGGASPLLLCWLPLGLLRRRRRAAALGTGAPPP